ncbi:MAG TPA: hypothetical protein VGH20_14880 [Myxococcales bacterium]|jgi:hypothetical protein
MGAPVVIVLWLVFAAIVCGTSLFVLRVIARRLIAEGPQQKRALRTATWFPFACFAWWIAVMSGYYAVYPVLFHRNADIADTWQCPLPNGYSMLMIDDPDYAFLYDPRTQPLPDFVGSQEDAVVNVRGAQVAGPFIAASTQERQRADGSKWPSPDQPDSFVLIDTRQHEVTQFATIDKLRAAAAPHFDLRLEPVDEVYARYCDTWLDRIMPLMTLLVPFTAGILVLVHFFRLRAAGRAV